jgi:hypothetical protein
MGAISQAHLKYVCVCVYACLFVCNRRSAAAIIRGVDVCSASSPLYATVAPTTNASKEDVLEALPPWFRACADDIYTKRHSLSFEAAFSRSANTTMPALRNIQLPHMLAFKRSECKLVHVSRAEICMCSLKMLRIRFEVSTPPCLHSNASCNSYDVHHSVQIIDLLAYTYM